jgi:Tfp pilus assembly protein PilF
MIMSASLDLAQRLLDEGFRKQKQGELDEAMRLYRSSLSYHQTAEAHTYIGWIYGQQGDLQAAINHCKQAIAVDPTLGNPYNDIGAYLIRLRRLEEAENWLYQAIEAPRYDNRAYPYMNLGRIAMARNDFWLALKMFKRAYEVDPGHLPALQARQELLGRMN